MSFGVLLALSPMLIVAFGGMLLMLTEAFSHRGGRGIEESDVRSVGPLQVLLTLLPAILFALGGAIIAALRPRALAMSRNLGTVHVGQTVGFDTVASFWRRLGIGTPPRGFPSITLGVFELTPFEVATAYTLFTNNGSVRPLHGIESVAAQGQAFAPPEDKLKPVTRPDVTYLVTNMMRSVLNEGTGAAARSAGFVHDAAGKTGTTNDLRDAWFVGFTPELLTVVWVGYDDNEPVGLSGAQAALPIWTEFMKAAMAGRPNETFQVPSGITFVEIDRDTGKLAAPGCERRLNESFLVGTEPTEICPIHGGSGNNGEGGGLFQKLGDLFGIGGH